MGLSGLVRPGWPTGWSDYSRGWLVMARPTKPRTSVTATVRLRRPLQPVGVARTETTETHRNQNLHHIIHASRQLSQGISSVIWRGRPWVSSVDTWRGRPTAPADMAHRTACIHIKYIAYTNKARYTHIAQFSRRMSEWEPISQGTAYPSAALKRTSNGWTKWTSFRGPYKYSPFMLYRNP